jgi:hypothetical protein
MECGLLYFRLTLIATKFCVAEEFRDVPEAEMPQLILAGKPDTRPFRAAQSYSTDRIVGKTSRLVHPAQQRFSVTDRKWHQGT